MYKCPKCGSHDTYKEKIMGQDTGDRVCQECNHITSAASFRVKEEVTEKGKAHG
ncbi:Eag protein [Vibrio fluvialis]|nr:Eag protein [Vibrio fluvialis]